MNRLPNVFANPINKEFSNTQDSFRSSTDKHDVKKATNINEKINKIFAAKDHVYKSRVKIYMKDEIIEETIVGKTNANLLTMDGKLIKISNIYDIEKI